MAKGVFGQVQFLDWTLLRSRGRAKLVFGYIMSLMCILGTLYGLHVKENAQHIAAVLCRRRSERFYAGISHVFLSGN